MTGNGAPTRAGAIEAVEEFRRRLRANARDANSYRALGRALRFLGAENEAMEAELGAIDASQHDPELRHAARALVANDASAAEHILRSIVAQRPDDAAAIRMLADVAIRTGFPRDAEKLARHALQLAPGFDYARSTLAAALDLLGLPAEALEELNRISGPVADDDETIALRAAILGRLGENEGAAQLFRELARRQPQTSGIWLNIGDHLRVVDDEPGAVEAYRRELELSPTNGEAWWSLANIKTFAFTDEDIASMDAALGSEGLSDVNRSQLHFALGKALEDRARDDAAFEHYRHGNAIRAADAHYEARASTELVEGMERLFTADFVSQRRDQGCKAKDPIFIVGLTRSGSTLIEQILASHSLVEGTGELPDVILLAKELEQSTPGGAIVGWRNYPEILREPDAANLKRLGESYLERTRIQRRSDRPFFTDKMPNNWFHVGFIRLMLPNARIIDARRHPLACGFSNFRQHYAAGQEFTYDLKHFGAYYADYVRLMAHFDRVAPGSIHRLIYERLLIDPEAEIRRLLEFLDLPFEEACLRFYETKRSVRTVSAEQVRRPIDASGINHWKRFERWLDPLKHALGRSLESWDR
jgi:tetratricopeptide (TPR) repeat protein